MPAPSLRGGVSIVLRKSSGLRTAVLKNYFKFLALKGKNEEFIHFLLKFATFVCY